MKTTAVPTISDLLKLSPEERNQALAEIDDYETAKVLTQEYLEAFSQYRQEYQLTHYEPVSEEVKKIHLALEHTVGAFGGKGSSKTDGCLVELIILGTGVVPDSLADVYPRQKIKAPGKYRIVVESITTTLEPIILPKLQWWIWDGASEPGGDKGHWGWIPRHMLIGGDWEKSYNNRTRMLTLSNGSTYQFMSFDQDPSDFASGSFHAVMHDEPPPHNIWRENLARVARYGGTMYLAMTPPDEAGGIPVDWIFDQIYEPGQESNPEKDPDTLSVTLFAEHNKHIDQEQIQKRAEKMTLEQREVFLHGKFLHLSNLVHPMFTDQTNWWCFSCNSRIIMPDGVKCPKCGEKNIESYCHVQGFTYDPLWPVIFILDPHPRKSHMMEWVAVNQWDDYFHVAELEIDGEVEEIARQVKILEMDLALNLSRRIMDPNMGASPSGARRHVTWKEEFERVGLVCDLGDDNFEVGKGRINNALIPDKRSRRPRMLWHPRCKRGIFQYKRYGWDEWARYRAENKDPKQKAKQKNDDFPSMDRYFINEEPTFDGLRNMCRVITRTGAGRMKRTGY